MTTASGNALAQDFAATVARLLDLLLRVYERGKSSSLKAVSPAKTIAAAAMRQSLR